ncbi:MAG: class I fructose-bisphosphate aldolase [Thermoplasmata archaeon]
MVNELFERIDSIGKRTRLKRLLYEHGVKNGKVILLPIDQGLEHGPIDFFANPDSLDPEFQLQLAKKGDFSGIVFHIGLAEKYMKEYAGDVPLVLKLNGKTAIPSDKEAFSGLTGTVEDAVRLGADAIGYTLYVGSPRQDEDFLQFMEVREEAERYGMPIIMWAYPRGEPIEQKGGRDSIYAVDYAARVACELGADIVKINYPIIDESKKNLYPGKYKEINYTSEESFRKVVKSAGRTMVLVSGGEKMSDDELINKVEMSMKGGATGIIFGRNMWQRKMDDALALTKRIKEIMSRY